MSAPEAKKGVPAGISAPQDIDVGDLFERLRDELRKGVGGGGSAGADFAATRARAERLLRELEERLTRIERRRAGGDAHAPVTVAAQPAAAALPDYFAFESR